MDDTQVTHCAGSVDEDHSANMHMHRPLCKHSECFHDNTSYEKNVTITVNALEKFSEKYLQLKDGKTAGKHV